jgi:hypothetical protein
MVLCLALAPWRERRRIVALARSEYAAAPTQLDVTRGSTAWNLPRAVVDINTARKDELVLKGCRSESRGGNYRGRPYLSGGDLLERGIVPPDIMERLKAASSRGHPDNR